jgi:uncharacterized protein (TIRG00374 family)
MIVGLVVFALYLYFFIGREELSEVLESINLTQYAIYYSLAILAVLASVFFWSAAWKNILKKLSVDISYRQSYFYYWVGNFADLTIPCGTVCGEVTRLYLVQQQTKNDYGILAASAVTNRIVAYTVVTAGLCIGSSLVLARTDVPPIVSNVFVLLLVGVVAYLSVLLFLAFYRGSAEVLTKVYSKLIGVLRPNKNNAEKIAKTKQSLANFYDGFKIFRAQPKSLIKPFVFHSLAYLSGLLIYVFVFYALGVSSVAPGFYIVVFFIATAFQDAAASFSVGTLDILLATIFLLYGIEDGTSGVAAIIVRTVSFWIPLFISFACVQIMGMRSLFASKIKGNGINKIEDKLP